MTHARSHVGSHTELVTLRKLAEKIAAGRKERVTTVHLVAAIARGDGPAATLLRERRLDDEALLKASRSFDDEGPDPMGRLFAAARQLAVRRVWTSSEGPRAAPEPTALHLLLAVLGDRRVAAHRSWVQAGIDLVKLRTAAMQLAIGVVAPRRMPTASAEPTRRSQSSAPPPPSGTVATARSLSERPRAASAGVERGRIAAPPAASIGLSSAPGVTVPVMPSHPVRTSPPPPAPKTKPAARASMPVAPVASSRFDLDPARFPALAGVGENLSLAAAEGRLAPVVGREEDIERALDVLAKKHGSSPCLIGPPGVGKTSIARGIAHRMTALDAASDAAPRVMIELSLMDLSTGRRGFAERLAAVRAEARELGGRAILFVDDLAELAIDPALDDALGELRAALAKGELRLVGTSTADAWRRYIEPDTTLARRLTAVEVDEPDEESAFFLVRSVANGLGEHHKLTYSDEAIASAVGWSVRYLPGRALPDKAISILDLAGARARRKLDEGRNDARAEGEAAVSDVAAVVAEVADVPVERLLETDRDRMLALEAELAQRVVGHDAAIARIARVVRRNAAGLRGRRPIGSFLILGPTGVGKTETAKALAEALFHSPDAMTRLDFSEYSEAHAVARLIGAPPGYVGHDAGGQLTEAVRKRPYQVILLDEIEKAHRDVLEAFLQVFDEGRLTDGRGRRVDFTNAVIVMTSNLGAAEVSQLRDGHRVGFAKGGASSPSGGASPERVAETMIAAARAHLPPELYNRIDEVLCYGPLARAEVAEIARRLLGGLTDTLEARGIRLDVEPAVLEVLLDAGGFDVSLGARPMKRTLARLIENPLAELILRGDLGEGAVAQVGVENGEIVVDADPAESPTERRAVS